MISRIPEYNGTYNEIREFMIVFQEEFHPALRKLQEGCGWKQYVEIRISTYCFHPRHP